MENSSQVLPDIELMGDLYRGERLLSTRVLIRLPLLSSVDFANFCCTTLVGFISDFECILNGGEKEGERDGGCSTIVVDAEVEDASVASVELAIKVLEEVEDNPIDGGCSAICEPCALEPNALISF